MKQQRRSIPAPRTDSSQPLNDFVALAANITDAFTVALFLLDESEQCLRMVACQSLSDHILPDVRLALDTGTVAGLFAKGVPFHEPYFEGDATEFGFYGIPEEIRAFMTAPVSSRGLLWMDTRKAYRFTAKSVKLISQFAANCRHMVELSELKRFADVRSRCDRLIQELLPEQSALPRMAHLGLAQAVEKIFEIAGFDGVLTAVRDVERNLVEITASAGFSHWVRPGRLVRGGPGWVSWALEHRSPVFLPLIRREEDPAILFHAGERFGFKVGSLAVVPWTCREQDAVLVMAGRTRNPILEENQWFWQFVAGLLSFIHSTACAEQVMSKVRRYDGESGLISEGYFREVTRALFSRARERGTDVALFLAQLKDVERLYVELDHSIANRFLQAFSDRLFLAAKGRGERGKYRTGGFGLVIEGLDVREAGLISENIRSALGSGRLEIDGSEIPYDFEVAYAHYPSECDDHVGLWRKVLNRIDLGKSERNEPFGQVP